MEDLKVEFLKIIERKTDVFNLVTVTTEMTMMTMMTMYTTVLGTTSLCANTVYGKD